MRFATKLGFEGYTQLQQHIRSNLSHRLSRPSERIRSDGEMTLPAKVAISNAISSVFAVVESDRMAALVDPLVRAENVWVLSGETSQAGAHTLCSGLSMVRPGDAALVFAFFRYRRQVASAARIFANAGVTVVAITDSPLSPLVELADTWCQIEIPAIGPFDSSVPVVAMCELLVAGVAKALQDDATDRIDRIEAVWKDTEVFL